MNESEDENSGAIQPRNTPKTSPKRICLVSDICHQGLLTCCACIITVSKSED